MKFNTHSTTPPHWILSCILALSIALSFTSCSDGSSGGSDDDSEQVTNSKATYTVTFDANGGSGTIESITEIVGTEITLPESTFTKDGYIFAGWNTKDDGTGTNYADKAKITVTADITLYAKWTLTAAGAPGLIRALPDDGETHTVSISGDMTADDFTALKEVLYGKKVCLDLSATTITEIPSNAFSNASNDCRGLAGIVLPASVEKIGNKAFYKSELETVIIPKSDTAVTIGANAFASSELKSIAIPGNVKAISTYAFSSCQKLASVVIEEGVQSIENQAFSNCRVLKSVTIPSTVIEIGQYAFIGCNALESTVVNSKTTGDSMFHQCTALKEVTLGTEVKTLTGYTFSYCSSLETVNILTNELSIGDCAFYECTVLKNVRIAGSETDCKITSSSLAGGNNSFDSAEKIYNYDFSQSN